jgi:hypothetical protein
LERGLLFANAQPTESNSESMQKDSLDGQEDEDKSQLQERMRKGDIYFFRVKGKLVFTKDKYACLKERGKSQRKTLRIIPILSFSNIEENFSYKKRK